jgi:hypothetical protein
VEEAAGVIGAIGEDEALGAVGLDEVDAVGADAVEVGGAAGPVDGTDKSEVDGEDEGEGDDEGVSDEEVRRKAAHDRKDIRDLRRVFRI